MSKASRNVPEALARNDSVRFGGRVSFGWLASDFGADGHIGDPTAASRDRGSTLFEGSVESLGAALREVRSFEFGH
jgi:creatinine amidohydrolase